MAARVAKEHDERKTEILGAAQALFNEHGYDSTSVNAIIEALGISKGTFYHYFSSKEDLLDALSERVTLVIMEAIRGALRSEEMDAIKRLNTYFEVSSRWKAQNPETILMFIKAIYRNENLLMRHKMTQKMIDLCVPDLAEIIQQGVGEGVFDVVDAHDAAELIMQIGVALRETTSRLLMELVENPEAWTVLVRKVKGFEQAVEKLLSAPEGSLRLMDSEAMDKFKVLGGKK